MLRDAASLYDAAAADDANGNAIHAERIRNARIWNAPAVVFQQAEEVSQELHETPSSAGPNDLLSAARAFVVVARDEPVVVAGDDEFGRYEIVVKRRWSKCRVKCL